MTRKTKGDIFQVVRVINNHLTHNGYFHKLYAEWAYGRPRIYLRDENGSQVRELSPRLSTGPMYDWLCAYEKGLCMGLMILDLDEVAL
jgi:hypothetical protein